MACILQHDFAGAIPALQNIRDVEWAMQRYSDKTVINPLQDSHRFIFGPNWEDDFEGLWEGAGQAGLSKAGILNLQRLMEAPETFLEFAEKMRDLELLSETSGEQSATAAYFYALGLFNMHTQVYWHQYYTYPWPQLVLDNILQRFEYAAANSANPELQVRARFMRGGVDRYVQMVKAYGINYYYLYVYPQSRLEINKESYLPYYRSLSDFTETMFGEDIMFNCPTAGDFMTHQAE